MFFNIVIYPEILKVSCCIIKSVIFCKLLEFHNYIFLFFKYFLCLTKSICKFCPLVTEKKKKIVNCQSDREENTEFR